MPIHRLVNENDRRLLRAAQESLEKQTNKNFEVLYFVREGVGFDEKLDGVNTKLIESDQSFSYQQAINKAVEKIESRYFSVLEFDDVFHPTYVENFYAHLNNQKEDVALYMNIVFEVNQENQMMGLRNETAWVVNKMQKMGFLDIDSIKQSIGSFSLVGACYEKNSFIESGGLKNNIEIFFNQEFILRFLNLGNDIYVMPKVLVNHMNFREGSYFDLCDKKFGPDEKRGYYNLIGKEYLYKQDRKVEI